MLTPQDRSAFFFPVRSNVEYSFLNSPERGGDVRPLRFEYDKAWPLPRLSL